MYLQILICKHAYLQIPCHISICDISFISSLSFTHHMYIQVAMSLKCIENINTFESQRVLSLKKVLENCRKKMPLHFRRYHNKGTLWQLHRGEFVPPGSLENFMVVVWHHAIWTTLGSWGLLCRRAGLCVSGGQSAHTPSWLTAGISIKLLSPYPV